MSVLNKPTLLLNAVYEPIQILTLEKALILQFKDKVHVEEIRDDLKIRSSDCEWDAPNVIRLKRYIDLYSKIRASTGKKRNKIYLRDRFKCSYCDKKCKIDEITLDHIIPKSRGGEDTPENLVTSCKPCNQKKGNRTPEEANMELLHKPIKLRVGLDKHTLRYYSEYNPKWKRYLFLEGNELGHYE